MITRYTTYEEALAAKDEIAAIVAPALVAEAGVKPEAAAEIAAEVARIFPKHFVGAGKTQDGTPVWWIQAASKAQIIADIAYQMDRNPEFRAFVEARIS